MLLAAQTTVPPLAIDGHFDDWDAREVLVYDAAGDAGASGIDFRALRITNDQHFLYVNIDFEGEVVLQRDNNITLLIDADASSRTGIRRAGVGAELRWTFGSRSGVVRLGGKTVRVSHADIGFVPAPTISSSRIEFALRRDVVINGQPLYTSDSIRLALLVNEKHGDRIPDDDGGVTYAWHNSHAPKPRERQLLDPGSGVVRVLTWNVDRNGLLDANRRPVFERMLRAIKADVMCFQECFTLSADRVRRMVESAIPAPIGRRWHAVKIDAGNILVTHLDVDQSWLIQQNYRGSAFLLNAGAAKRMLLINAHFRCCDADEHRQKEADGVIAFLRDAKTPGGRAELPRGTPIVIAGDLNLVGDRRQLSTLLTGDILDNNRFGPDRAPGWNGAELTVLESVHPTSRFIYTWYNANSSFAPGKLDYILYTSDIIDAVWNMTIDTRKMSNEQLKRLGLKADDAVRASDHFPRVADFLWRNFR